jgi:hypothetical protein
MLPHDKSFFFWPGKASMQFLDPVDPTSFENPREMKEHVFQLMWKTLATHLKTE